MAKYAGVSAENRTAVRRTTLLDAGLELLGTVGFDKTTMTAICAQAGLTERYFYESFRSRRDLLVSVVDLIAIELRVGAVEAVARTEGQAEQRVRAAMVALVSVLTDDPRKGRAFLVETASVDYLREYRQTMQGAFSALIVEQAEQLYDEQALPHPRNVIGALMFTGGITELIVAQLNRSINMTTDDVVDAAVHLFTSSMHT